MTHKTTPGLWIVPLIIAGAGVVAAAPATQPAPMPAQFAPLLDRSIFAKGRPAAPTTAPTSRPAPQPAEAALVFNGVTKVGSQLTAFIENRSTGRISTVRLDDTIAQGKIVGITLDALEYEANGQVIRIAIGENFQGQTAGRPTSRPVDSAAPVDASPEMQSVLERLRQRREKELHKD